MYLGDGGQWDDVARAEMHATDRKTIEQNEIFPAVNAAIGYQISNRMDISFIPRGHGADDETADTLGKVARQIADNNKMHWVETDIFSNGMIRRRGYWDIRACFDDSITGEVDLSSLDPCDVAPDCDASDYDPDKGWNDVSITRWYTADQIEQYYGKEARDKVQNCRPEDTDVQSWDAYHSRTKFGNNNVGGDYYGAWMLNDHDSVRYRVIDRQYKVYEVGNVLVYPTGDIRPMPSDAGPEEKMRWQAAGAVQLRRKTCRIMWLVTTSTVTLFDDESPYPFFTIVPYFPYFRHGRTRGMVDNAISPQEVLNKALSTGLDILNKTAKGGWQGEKDQVTNMTDSELRENLAKPGIVILRKPGTPALTPIQPPSIPAAVGDYINRAYTSIKSVTGSNEELNAENTEGMSGIAIQARQFAAQQKLAVPLDNLARTRNMLAAKMLWFIQRYYTAPRILRITEKDIFGQNTSKDVPINQPKKDEYGEETGQYLNDLTIGEYDVAISEQPLAVTFDNTQFEQLKAMKELGYPVPASFMVRYSNVADKKELIEAIESAQNAPQQLDPLSQAQADLASAKAAVEKTKEQLATLSAELTKAQVEKTRNESTQAGVVAIYSATQAAAEIASMPQVAGIADAILGSAGFADHDAPPIVPTPAGPVALPQEGAGLANVAPRQAIVPPQQVRGNTDPVSPPNPATPASPGSPRIGADQGIEKPGVQ